MKKVYLEKRDSENFESDFEVAASSSLVGGEEFTTTLNSGMEEDLGLDDLASLIQLELDNYTSCFSDMLDMHTDNTELPKNFFIDGEEESPSHSISYEYVIPPTLLHEDLSKPKTTSGWIPKMYLNDLSNAKFFSDCREQSIHRSQQNKDGDSKEV